MNRTRIRIGDVVPTEWPMEWVCKRCGCNRMQQLEAIEPNGKGETWKVLRCESKVCGQ